jgi:23S rRNA (pseudouridine1915-N3)-methyltransferase
MLKVTLLFAAKKLAPPTFAGLQEYKKRLSHSCQFDWQTGVEPPAAEEGESYRANGQSSQNQHILLDRTGLSYTSPEFASQIQSWMTNGTSQLVIYIGMPQLGRRPNCDTLSLSPLALSSNTAGLLLAEQIYRAFRILEGKAYHK